MSDSEFQRVYQGYIPIKYKEATILVSQEYIDEQIIKSLSIILMRYCDDYIQRILGEQILLFKNNVKTDIESKLEGKLEIKQSIIGFSLLTIILIISVLLSTMSYFMFNIPQLGILFLYGAFSALGGMMFTGYKIKRNNQK